MSFDLFEYDSDPCADDYHQGEYLDGRALMALSRAKEAAGIPASTPIDPRTMKDSYGLPLATSRRRRAPRQTKRRPPLPRLETKAR